MMGLLFLCAFVMFLTTEVIDNPNVELVGRSNFESEDYLEEIPDTSNSGYNYRGCWNICCDGHKCPPSGYNCQKCMPGG